MGIVGYEATPIGPVLGLVPVLIVLLVGLRRPWRRWRVAQEELSAEQRRWLRTHVALKAGPSVGVQPRVEGHVRPDRKSVV